MTNINAGALSAQVLITGTGGTVQANAYTAQVLAFNVAAVVQATALSAQVLVLGSTGAIIDISSLAAQVLYTTGAPATAIQHTWGFELDGHFCYALDLGTYGTLVFDKSTNQWYKFNTDGFSGEWNMKNGFQWLDGRKIVAGDIASGDTYYLDASSLFDDGWRPIIYEMTGAVFAAADDYLGMYSVRLIGGSGKPSDTITPELELQYSDDEGQTWTSAGTVTLATSGNQRISWTSLGSFSAPGRLLKFVGTGGLKYIGYVVAFVDG